MDAHTRRLRYFVVLAEELHYTRAAGRLHVSQQGLSHSVKELEETLGVALLLRTTRTVVLTAAGTVFLRGARATLSSFDAAVDAAQRIHHEVAGELRVGFTVSTALELTGPILQAFKSRYPKVELHLEQFEWRDPSCGLRSGATDVAFLRLPIDCLDLGVQPLLTEPRAIGVRTSHRLADVEQVRLRDLSSERIMAPSTDDEVWSAFWTLRDTGLNAEQLPQVGHAAASMAEEFEAVAAGLAITITALSMSRFMPRPSVVLRPIEDVVGTTLALGWRGDQSSAVRAFCAVAAEVCDQEGDLIRRIETASGNPEDF